MEEVTILIRIGVAALLGLVLGIQREIRKHEEKTQGVAGMRTHAIIAMGASIITAIGVLYFPADPIRLAASILTGIGFVGASTVLATQGKIIGLTNAATIWIAAAIGISTGVGLYTSASALTILAILILELKAFEKSDLK